MSRSPATPPRDDPAPAGAVVLTLRGTPRRDDGPALEAALAALPPAAAVVLDCRELGGMSAAMAQVVARWWRRLADTGRELRVRGANVVVRWMLERHLGAAAAAVLGDAAAERCPPATADPDGAPPPAHPRRDLFHAVRAALTGEPDPAVWEDRLAEQLAAAGLAERVRLLLREGDRLVSPAHPGAAVPADGWLGSLLAGADCPVAAAELRDAGLALEEQALLRWSGADLVVPLCRAGRLAGLLLVTAGRPGGWSAYRSGEVLALDLLGRMMVALLEPVAEPMAAPADGPTVEEAAAEAGEAAAPDALVPVAAGT